MRSNPIGHIALLLLALQAFAQSALASERFMCTDGTFVDVTHQNRAEQYQHPCVREWFERRAERRKKTAVNPATPSAEATETSDFGAVVPVAATAAAIAPVAGNMHPGSTAAVARPVAVTVRAAADRPQSAKNTASGGQVRVRRRR